MKTLSYLGLAAAVLGAGSIASAFPFLNSWHMPSAGDPTAAPSAGAGPVIGYYSVVDGDHDGKSSLDDDVKVGQLKLAQGN